MSDEYFITIEALPDTSAKNWGVKGKFSVPYQRDGITAHGAQVLKHIILVVTRGGNYKALAPYQKVIVFQDDVNDNGDSVAGAFNLPIQPHIEFDGAGDYYVLCSLGMFLSNIVKISIK